MNKKVLMKDVQSVYTAYSFKTPKGTFVAAGSETTPQVYLYDFKSQDQQLVADCPGGVMSFVPLPGSENVFYSIQGLFPPFKGAKAGVFQHIQKSDSSFETSRLMPLPFAHRCDTISAGGKNWLFAASCSLFKAEPLDWSKAGEVFVIEFDAEGNPSAPHLVGDKIYRNHGMLKAVIEGEEKICVSGAEGIFCYDLQADGQWTMKKLFDRETSEFGFIDLDGDGQDELVTIEPFHGNTINVYKRGNSQWDSWELKYTSSLSFGHGLSCGMFQGKPIFVVGNRRESLTLDMFTVVDLEKGQIERTPIEENAGPTQTQIFSVDGVDYILSANQLKNEVAVYF